MQSLGGDKHLDEVHCLWPLCSHPCCWETEWRITTGVYRRAVGVPAKHHTSVDERSPRLTVVDVSEWAGTTTRPVKPDRRNLSRKNYQAELLQKDTDTKTTDPRFPAIASAPVKSHSRNSGTRNKAVNDLASHIRAPIGSPCRSVSLVLWVPNPHHIPQSFKSIGSESPRCAIKELICFPAAHTHTTSELVSKSDPSFCRRIVLPFHQSREKGTTKKRVRFQICHSPLRFHPSQQVASVSAGQEEGAADSELLRDFPLRNRPVVLHSVHESNARRASQDAPASLYKLDNKTAHEDIDWERLRTQPYLWKRRNVFLEGFSPQGGARGTWETGSSYPGSKASSDRTLRSPQCAGPMTQVCVKRMQRYSRCTDPLLSHKKHCRGTGSELDMTICSSSIFTKHHQILNTDKRYKRNRDSKGTVDLPNSEFDSQHFTHELYDNYNVTPDPSPVQRFITGAIDPWGERSTTEHLCTSTPVGSMRPCGRLKTPWMDSVSPELQKE